MSSTVLMGEYQNSIDTKGRMIVPSKFRDELGFKCVLTLGLDQCLWIYPMSQWDKQQEKLTALPMSDPKARAFIRYFYANATECEIDKQGRLNIPQKLKAQVKISKELVTIGLLNHVEIWSKEVYESSANGGQLDATDFSAFADFYQI